MYWRQWDRHYYQSGLAGQLQYTQASRSDIAQLLLIFYAIHFGKHAGGVDLQFTNRPFTS